MTEQAPHRADNKDISLEDVRNTERELLLAARQRDGIASHQNDDSCLVGLAFSGGGIRSATFNLGILQALAKYKLLRRFDYLSCVSGGNYIGTWFSSLARRLSEQTVNTSPVIAAEQLLSEVAPPRPNQPSEPHQVTYLRNFSNYLAPKAGGFTVDTWTAVSTYTRNLILNLTLAILFLACLLVVPQLVSSLFQYSEGRTPAGAAWIGMASLGLVVFSVIFIAKNLRDVGRPLSSQSLAFRNSQLGVLICVVLPSVLASVLVSWAMYVNALEPAPDFSAWSWWTWVASGMVFYFGCWLVGGFFALFSRSRSWSHSSAGAQGNSPSAQSTRAQHFWVIVTALPAGAILGWILFLTNHIIAIWAGWKGEQKAAGAYLAAAMGPVLIVLFAFSLAVVMHIGLAKRAFTEGEREWWARLGAWSVLIIVTWAGLFAARWVGVAFVAWASAALAALGVAWVATTVMGIAFGSSKTDAKSVGIRKVIISLAPTVFVIGALILISSHLNDALNYFGPKHAFDKCGGPTIFVELPKAALLDKSNTPVAEGSSLQFTTGKVTENKAPMPDFNCFLFKSATSMANLPSHVPWAALALCALFVGLLGWRVDVNLFSFHQFYRNRLTRCYLGATQEAALHNPHPFTGFDPGDDMSISELANCDPKTLAPLSVQRPYHLTNTALNLSRGGEHLSWQQRQAASFLFSPLYCGYEFPPAVQSHRRGWIRTPRYMSTTGKGPMLGSLMAVSGAAVSPVAGSFTSPQLAFLLALFNVRLGRWCPNPAAGKREILGLESPHFGAGYFLKELFADVDERSNFVHLSDGGHFENLGVYELVRRRCALIVACDAGADPQHEFTDLGNLIRKCRIDLGVDIDIDVAPLKKTGSLCSAHYALGTIDYGSGATGTLVYIKASLTGKEPTDVQVYATEHAEFPHESTADQFFDESQFESYRKLGLHVGQSIFKPVSNGTATQCAWVGEVRDKLRPSTRNEGPMDALARGIAGP